ncbi:sugar-binding protein [Cohnella sp. GCM10027633]|uniref:sugar-binding protein n=1 Tax=unclassified Cohnella TaxID=2636738 RepID=UPI003645E140
MRMRKQAGIVALALGLALPQAFGAAGTGYGGGTAYAADVPLNLNGDADLVAHWPFEQISEYGMTANLTETTSTTDPSGSGAVPQTVDGKYGSKAALFDGAGKVFYANTTKMTAINDSQALTFTATVRVDQGSDWNGIVGMSGWHVRVNDANGVTASFTGGSVETAAGTISVGDWHHIAVTLDDGTAEIYVDGVKSAEQSGLTATISSNFHLGSLGGWAPFRGAIDDMRFYKRELSGAEIAALASDVTPPQPPANLEIAAQSEDSVTVRWDKADDDVGSVSYAVYVDAAAAPSTTVTGTEATIGGFSRGVHTAKVVAKDEAGNVSEPATIPFGEASSDTTPPAAPGTPTAGAIADRSVALGWTSSTDNEGVAAYHIYADGGDEPILTVDAPAASVIADFDAALQGFGVVDGDASKATVTRVTDRKQAGAGAAKVAFLPMTDDPATGDKDERSFQVGFNSPSGIQEAGGTLTAWVYVPETTNVTLFGLHLFGEGWSWNGKFEGTYPKGKWFPLSVALNGNPPSPRASLQIATAGEAGEVYVDSIGYFPGTASATLTGLTPDTPYTFTVVAEDFGGNRSAASAGVDVRTLTPDEEAPTAPTAPGASDVTDTGATLTWTKSTDNRGIAEYLVYEEGGADPIAVVPADASAEPSMSYSLGGLEPMTTYRVTLKVKDVSGLLSDESVVVEFRTADFASNENSPLGMNLSGVADWGTQQPFKDVFKSARGWNNDAADPGLDLDENGWVKSLGAGQTAYALLLVGDFYEEADYVVLYDGEGELSFEWGGQVVSEEPGRIVIHVTPGAGVKLNIAETNPADYIRNIRVMLPEYEDNYEDEPFTPEFLRLWSGFNSLRFMDFQRTNDSANVSWATRATPDYYRQSSSKGVAIEYMVELANTLHADPWFNMPTKADDAYVRAFAEYVKANLDPELKPYVEWSNETWNSSFAAHQYAVTEGQKLGYTGNNMEISYQFHAHRAKKIFEIWADVFADDPDRVMNVLGGFHVGGRYMTDILLEHEDVYEVADAIAIAPYFGHVYGGERAEQTKTMTLDQIFAGLPEEVDLALEEAKEVVDAAADKGVATFAYEAGQHMVGTYHNGIEYYHDDALTAKLIAVNRDPRMAGMYESYLNGWKNIGGRQMMVFASMAAPSKWGSWGIVEDALQNPNDAPKYKAVMKFVRETPQWWDDDVPPTPGTGGEDPVEQAEASMAGEAVSIDGQLDESMWELNGTADIAISGTPNNDVAFGTLWDEDYLYVAVKVTDGSIVKDSDYAHLDDSVEIYIDGNHDKANTYDVAFDRQFAIRMNDATLFEKSNRLTGASFAYATTDDGYAVELAIPWSNFGVTEPAGDTTVIGFDIGVNDDDEGGDRDSQLMWSGNGDNWQSTKRFGDLALSSDTVGGEPGQPMTVGAVNLVDWNGNAVTGLAANAFVRASVTVSNETATGRQAALIVALKDANGRVLNVSVAEKTVGGSLDETLSAGFLLPSSTSGLYIEAFVWDGMDTMVPLSDAATFPARD